VRASSALKAFLLLSLLAGGAFATPATTADARAAEHEATPPQTLAPMLGRVSPAIVNISVQGLVPAAQNPLLQDPVFRHFFGLPDGSNSGAPATHRFQAAGSGVIYDAERGYVITNHHVVERADKILVTLTDRRQLNARIVGSDSQTDIAVLKIDATPLTAIPLGTSKELQVGDYVVAIGNPFGVGQTATF
jgi:S1-C subfamily serine protease